MAPAEQGAQWPLDQGINAGPRDQDGAQQGVCFWESNVGVDELLALPNHEADVHLIRVRIDSAVELGGALMEVGDG